MKTTVCIIVLVAMAQMTNAATLSIPSDPADAEVIFSAVNSTTLVAFPGNFSMQAGNHGGFNGAPVFVFALPERPAGQIVTDADFSAFLFSSIGSQQPNLDLYGLGARSVSTVLLSDFYYGAAPDPTDATLLQAAFMTPSASNSTRTETNATGDSILASYLNALYDGGAGVGDFAFLRLNGDVTDTPNLNGYELGSSTFPIASGVPNLDITFETIPEPTTAMTVALVGLSLALFGCKRDV